MAQATAKARLREQAADRVDRVGGYVESDGDRILGDKETAQQAGERGKQVAQETKETAGT